MKLFFLAAFAISLVGCSSSKSDSKPVPTTPFGKATAASWLSECFKADQWYYKETMTLDGVSAGSTTGEYFANPGCTQSINKKGSANFNYSSKELSETRSIVTIFNPNDKNKATSVLDVNLSNNGAMMRVTTQDGRTINYARIFEQSGARRQTGNADGRNSIEAFDRIAVGTWITNDCQGGINGSYKEYITIQGNGRALSRYDLYDANDCSYGIRPTQDQGISYNVKQFAGNAGQVEIAGEVSTISFPSPAFMNITNAQGRTLGYKRVR